jgi:hypothetical protein
MISVLVSLAIWPLQLPSKVHCMTRGPLVCHLDLAIVLHHSPHDSRTIGPIEILRPRPTMVQHIAESTRTTAVSSTRVLHQSIPQDTHTI